MFGKFKNIIVIVAAILSAYGCSPAVPTSPEKTSVKSADAEEKVTTVDLPTTHVKRSIVPQTITFPGKVTALPDCSVSVSPNIAGKLIEVKVVPGQVVSKGQLIARLDDRQLRAQLLQADAPQQTALNGVAQAKINLDLAEKTLSRTETLFAKDIVAQKDVVTAHSQADLAKSQVEAARSKVAEVKVAPAQVLTQLAFMKVYAPISGIVAHRYLNVGSAVDPTTPIIHVVNLTKVMINANMPADTPTNTRVGQYANISTVAEPGIVYRGQIKSISPMVDPTNNTVSIEVLTNNERGNLKEGQQVNVSISTAQISAIMVPEAAIVPGHDDPSDTFVYVVHGDKLRLTKVKVGEKIGTVVPVLSGLNSGDEIVASEAYGVADGAILKRGAANENKPAAEAK